MAAPETTIQFHGRVGKVPIPMWFSGEHPASSSPSYGPVQTQPATLDLSTEEERLSHEDMWNIFAEEVRQSLNIEPEAFIEAYRAGHFPNPDDEPVVMYLLALYQHTY